MLFCCCTGSLSSGANWKESSRTASVSRSETCRRRARKPAVRSLSTRSLPPTGRRNVQTRLRDTVTSWERGYFHRWKRPRRIRTCSRLHSRPSRTSACTSRRRSVILEPGPYISSKPSSSARRADISTRSRAPTTLRLSWQSQSNSAISCKRNELAGRFCPDAHELNTFSLDDRKSELSIAWLDSKSGSDVFSSVH
jgi:hypothetical protein